MTLDLYFHPLASFCWKVLIALYENGTAFEPRVVNLGDAASRAERAERERRHRPRRRVQAAMASDRA